MCLVPFAVLGSVIITFIVTSLMFATMWMIFNALVIISISTYMFYRRAKQHPLNDIATDYKKPLQFIQEPYDHANYYSLHFGRQQVITNCNSWISGMVVRCLTPITFVGEALS